MGNDSAASAAGYTPGTGSSAKPLPGPLPPYDRGGKTRHPLHGKCHEVLDAKRHRYARQLLPTGSLVMSTEKLFCRVGG